MENKTYLSRIGSMLSRPFSDPEILDIRVTPQAVEKTAREKEEAPVDNAVFIVQGKIALEAVEDKIIIMLDPFRTGYECKQCDGTGIEKACHCETGQNRLGGTCKDCSGEPTKYAGQECRVCKGVGSLLVVPESAKALPTSGRVVSRGPLCKTIKVGERYIFGVHVGYFLPFKGNILLRCMREHEVLCRIYSIDKHIAMGDYFAVQNETASMGR